MGRRGWNALTNTAPPQASAAHVELSPAQQRLRCRDFGSKASADEAAAAASPSAAAAAARRTLHEASSLLAELVGLRRAAEAMRPGVPAVGDTATGAAADGSPLRAHAGAASACALDSPPQPLPPRNSALAVARLSRTPNGGEARPSGGTLRTARSGPRHPRVSFAPDIGPTVSEETDAGLTLPTAGGRPGEGSGRQMNESSGASAAGFVPGVAGEACVGAGSSSSGAASTSHADGWNDDEDMIDLTEEPAAPLQEALTAGVLANAACGAAAAPVYAHSSDRSAAAAAACGSEEGDTDMVDLTADGTASAPQLVDLGEEADDSIDVDLTVGVSPLRTRAAAVSEAETAPAGGGDDHSDDEDEDDEDFIGTEVSGSDSASDGGSGSDSSSSGDGEAVGGENEDSSAAAVDAGGDGEGDGSDDDGGALRRLFEDVARPATVVPVSARSGRGMLTRLAEARCRAALDCFGPWALTALPATAAPAAAAAATGSLPPSAEASPPLYPPSVFQSRPLSDACAVTWLCVAAEWRQVAYARFRARAAAAAAGAAAADACIAGSAAGKEAIAGSGDVAAATATAVRGASYLDSFASALLRPLLFEDDRREGAGSCAAGEAAAMGEGVQREPEYLRALCGGTTDGGAAAIANAITQSAALVPRFPRTRPTGSRFVEIPADAAAPPGGREEAAEIENASAPNSPTGIARPPSADALRRFEAAFAATPLLARASRSSRGLLPRAVSDGSLDPLLGALVAQVCVPFDF